MEFHTPYGNSMFKVVETFSGIGAQAKALSRIGKDFEIINTCDWDINAIISYCRIHKGVIDLEKYADVSDDEIDAYLRKHTLSMDGKKPVNDKTYNRLTPGFKRLTYAAICDTKNLVSITDVRGNDIAENVDLFTYSFPCQDLSMCGYWHGNKSGIARDAHNRSGMLWEVERILKEMYDEGRGLPHFLVMENVTNILSTTHKADFDDWKNTLNSLGYYNKIYRLNAKNFGVPQKRERAYMVSILVDGNSEAIGKLNQYFEINNLEKSDISKKFSSREIMLKNILRLDYSDPKLRQEADASQPNDTPSRMKIYQENDMLYDGKNINEINVNTVTTKQDRNPNSGLITYSNNKSGKTNWRYLMPRELFMLMGFDEEDYERAISSNPEYLVGRKLLTTEKIVKMAGNSICVDVLEAIFKQIYEINDLLYL